MRRTRGVIVRPPIKEVSDEGGEEGEMDLLETLKHVLNLAEENTKGIDGYEQIAEWARNAIISQKQG